MKIITLDFETYYTQDYSLSKITTEEYIRGDLFEAIGVATKVDDGPIVWVTGKKINRHLQSLPWGDHLLLAQHTAFDGAILNWRYGIAPAGYLDTMSMANALHGISESSSLANLAKLYGEVEKGNAVVNAKGKHLADFTPTELAEYGDYCIHDAELCYNIFHKMMPIFPKEELHAIDLTIRMYTQPKLLIDKKMLEDDLVQIRANKRGALLTLMNLLGVKGEEAMKKQVMSNDKFAELLKLQGIDPPTKISEKTGKEAWAFAKTDEEFTALGESDNPIVATLISTRLESKSTILESRTAAFVEIAGRGEYPFSLSYSGAKVTHRWSGFDTNPQNLPRGSTLRKSLMAPEGYSIIAYDLSNIELRVGMWLAGQHDAVEQLRNGVDLYRTFASEAFNLSYDAVGKNSAERFIAKVCCLSLIFGTGAPKLKQTVRIQSRGKTTVRDDEAERFKNLYRAKNSLVVGAWSHGSDALEWILHDQKHSLYGVCVVDGRHGIVKPSGLILPFPGLTRAQGDKGMEYYYNIKRGRTQVKTKAYGAKVFQRCVQSLARDIMAGMLAEINKLYDVVGCVHDDVLVCVLDSEADEANKDIHRIMSTPPIWGPDIPIDCEGGIKKRYG